MDMKKRFDSLENSCQDITDRIAEEFPPHDETEKEKVFRMSERKFNDKSQSSVIEDEQSVSGVEVYKRPLWKKCLSVAAAAALVAGGTAGGMRAYRHFSNAPAENGEEIRVLPFSDFAETNYKVCDYSTDPLYSIDLRSIIAACNDDADFLSAIESNEETCIDIYGGTEISAQKRAKIADFLNSYNYISEQYKLYFSSEADTFMVSSNGAEKTIAEYRKAMADEIMNSVDENVSSAVIENEPDTDEPLFDNMADTGNITTNSHFYPDLIPYFQYNENNEIKSICIYNYLGKGTLLYYQFSYEETDGEYVISPETFATTLYEIDYNVFSSTITDILNAEDDSPEAQPTEQKISGNCPFDFAAHDFMVPDYSSRTAITVKLGEEYEDDGQLTFNLYDGDVIPLEKRRQLADFFNSLDWEESNSAPSTPNWLSTYEYFDFFNLAGDDFICLAFDRDSGTMQFAEFDIRLVSSTTDDNADALYPHEMQAYKIYEAADSSFIRDNIFKVYKIDYDLVMNKISEILGYEPYTTVADVYSFLNKDWTADFNGAVSPVALSKEDREYLLYMFRDYNWWNSDSDEHELISAEEAKQVYGNDLPAESDDYVILSCNYFDDHDVIYFENTNEPTTVRFVQYSIQGENRPGEEYIRNTTYYSCQNADIIWKIKQYLCSRHPEASKEASLDLSVMDEVKWEDTGFDTRNFVITQEKMQRVKECMQRYSWTMTETRYYDYDTAVIGDWNDIEMELSIGKDHEGNSLIRFAPCEPVYSGSEKTGYETAGSPFESANKKYICEGEKAYEEIMAIISK